MPGWTAHLSSCLVGDVVVFSILRLLFLIIADPHCQRIHYPNKQYSALSVSAQPPSYRECNYRQSYPRRSAVELEAALVAIGNYDSAICVAISWRNRIVSSPSGCRICQQAGEIARVIVTSLSAGNIKRAAGHLSLPHKPVATDGKPDGPFNKVRQLSPSLPPAPRITPGAWARSE